jgi:hypothetical protein
MNGKDALDTPALLVDLDRLERNIERMKSLAGDEHGSLRGIDAMNLRPGEIRALTPIFPHAPNVYRLPVEDRITFPGISCCAIARNASPVQCIGMT